MKRSENSIGFERLEDRKMLTVTAVLQDGLLLVEGSADGDVEIVADESGVFSVMDNQQLIGSFSDVRDIDVILNDATGLENDVVVDLGDNSLDTVFGHLGHSSNRMTVFGNEAINRVIYVGGEGADNVIVGVETRSTIGLLRGGSDHMAVTSGTDWLLIRAGEGDDSVTVYRDRSGTIGAARIKLGHGDNSVDIFGEIDNQIMIQGGKNSDAINLRGSAVVGGRLTLKLASGDNTTQIDGQVDGKVRIRGGYETFAAKPGELLDLTGAGSNSIKIGSQARFNNDLSIVLNGGDADVDFRGALVSDFHYMNNEFTSPPTGIFTDALDPGSVSATESIVKLRGDIAGDVQVLSGCGDDNVFVNQAQIGGDLWSSTLNDDDIVVNVGVVAGVVLLEPGQFSLGFGRPDCAGDETVDWHRGEIVCQ